MTSEQNKMSDERLAEMLAHAKRATETHLYERKADQLAVLTELLSRRASAGGEQTDAIDHLDAALCQFLNNVGDEYDPREWLPSVRTDLGNLSKAYNQCHVVGVMDLMKPDHAALRSKALPDVSEERWRKNSRDTFDAMCAMRNSINEHIPIPSLESDLLQGPENSVFCATVAEAVVSRIKRDEELLQRALERLNDIYDPQDDALYELRAALNAAQGGK